LIDRCDGACNTSTSPDAPSTTKHSAAASATARLRLLSSPPRLAVVIAASGVSTGRRRSIPPRNSERLGVERADSACALLA